MEKVDKNQDKAIRSLKNTVVTAGAGSGKTSVLVKRFIHLLKTKDASIDEILTLTFTNKAAAEMYERIYVALLKEDDPRLKKQLFDFHLAQISTIDSFSAQVARSAAARFGLPDDFVIDEEALKRLAEETALAFYLAHAGRPSIEFLVGRYGLSGFCSGILVRIALAYLTLAEATDWTGLLERQYSRLGQELPVRLAAYGSACAALLHGDFGKCKTIMDNRAFLAHAAELPALCAKGQWPEALAALEALRLVKPGGRANEITVRLKELIDAVRIEGAALRLLFHAFAEHELRADLHDLLALFQQDFHEKKRAAKLASFSDVARMAVIALRDEPSLREYYKHRYRFIMIDEFQDNNHLQKELLFLLAENHSLALERVPGPGELEPGKLFFVGDEKQSIYGFRGAEVDVFKALRREIEANGGEAVSLAANYRSAPGLIAFFNRVFERVMERPAFDFEAGYEELTPGLEPNGPRPSVTLFHATAPERGGEEAETREFSEAESEAFALAAHIRRTVESGSLAIDAGGAQRPSGYGDFALLLRSTGNQIVFERMFRHVGVPYETQSIRSLFMEPPVNDIYALLQCALHPDDRVAYATLLRSPFVSLSDAALLHVLETGAAPFAPVDLAGEDVLAYGRGRAGYEWVRDRLDLVPVSRLVFYAWYELGYRYDILRQPSAAMYLEYYEYLYALALRADGQAWTLERFLAWIRANLGQYEKLEDIELPQANAAGVKIMTIHKAKGLQFPVVIAANLGNRGRQRERRAAVHFSREFGPVVNLGEESFLAARTAEEEERRALAELKRLLYVALTRAQNHLILSGVFTAANRNSEKALFTMLFNALGLSPERPDGFTAAEYDARLVPIPLLTEEEFKRMTRRGKKRDIRALAERAALTAAPALDLSRTEFSVTELNELYRSTFPEPESDAHSRELPALRADALLKTDEARARWGTLTHEILHEKLLGRYERDGLANALRGGFEDEAFEALCAEAENLADVFLSSEWGRRFAAASEKATEFPFVYRYAPEGPAGKEYFIRGAIDLYFIEAGRAFLLDFKTDRILNPGEYEIQLGLYRTALTGYIGLPVTAALYAVRSGETIELKREFAPEEFFPRLEAAGVLGGPAGAAFPVEY